MKPTEDEIRRQLDSLVASDGFANADRMSGFLRYVVERTLAGESGQIKEYVIGVEVFGRDEHYDPRLDSIVRVEARRLRTKVDEYYATAGSGDSVLIRIPRGSYVPVFERRTAELPAPAPVMSAPESLPGSNERRNHRGLRLALGLAAATIVLVSLAAWRSGLWDNHAPAASVA